MGVATSVMTLPTEESAEHHLDGAKDARAIRSSRGVFKYLRTLLYNKIRRILLRTLASKFAPKMITQSPLIAFFVGKMISTGSLGICAMGSDGIRICGSDGVLT